MENLLKSELGCDIEFYDLFKRQLFFVSAG